MDGETIACGLTENMILIFISRDACTIRSAHALNYVVENVTVSLHYWYHACDETLGGTTGAYFCRLHSVFHLTVHVGSILIFLNVAYAMHYDVFTWMPIQNNKGAFL